MSLRVQKEKACENGRQKSWSKLGEVGKEEDCDLDEECPRESSKHKEMAVDFQRLCCTSKDCIQISGSSLLPSVLLQATWIVLI